MSVNQDLIADIWNVVSEHIPEQQKKDVATEFVTTLLDHGVSENVLEGLFGICTYLDGALEYAIDEDEIEDFDEDEY